MDKTLFHVQYITNPAGNVANKNRKTKGSKSLFWLAMDQVG